MVASTMLKGGFSNRTLQYADVSSMTRTCAADSVTIYAPCFDHNDDRDDIRVWKFPVLLRREFRTRAPIDTLGQLGVEHDLGVENLGDWAVLLGVSRQIGELCFVEVGHFGAQRQS